MKFLELTLLMTLSVLIGTLGYKLVLDGQVAGFACCLYVMVQTANRIKETIST